MKKYTILVLLFLSIIWGQNPQYEDSLKNEIKFSSGKKLVNQYLQLIEYYTDVSPEDAIKTAKIAINIARENESENLGKLYLLATSNFSNITQNDSAMHYCDLALDFYTERKDTLGISRTYLNIGINYDILGKGDEALAYYQKAQDLADAQNLENILAAVYINSGVIFMRQGKYSEALSEYLKALSIDQKSQNQDNITNSYINLGNVLMTANNYEKATDYFYKALEIAEQQQNYSNLLFIHVNMSELFKLKHDYSNAMEHTNETINLAAKVNQKVFYTSAILDRIDLLILTKNMNEIDSLFSIVQNNLYELNSVELAANFYDVKCRYAIACKEFDLALTFHNQAVEKLENHYYAPDERFRHQIRLAKIKANLGEIDEAINLINNVISQCTKIEDLEIKVDAYKELYQIYEKKNDFKNAFLNLKKFTHNADSLFALQNKSNIEELEIIHNIQKQNQENELIKKEKIIVESRLNAQRIVLTAFLFLTLFSVFGVIYVTRSLMNKRKINKKLILQNDTIIEQKLELEKTIASKDRLYSIIGHDLFNAHSNIASFINILNRNIDKIDPNFIRKMTEELKTINDGSLALLNTLVEWGKIQTKKQAFSPANFNFKALCHTNLMLFKKNIEEKNIDIINNTDEKLEIYGDKNMIATVIRNILSNAVKFTPNNGQITIRSQKVNSTIEVEFEDNGIGIQPDILPQLFQIENTITTRGTLGEKGHGLGLLICKELVEFHKGEISIESKPRESTKVKIRFPEQ